MKVAMQQEIHAEPANEQDSREGLARQNARLGSRLELYRWLFWAAVFLLVVLLVAQRAHRG